MSVIKDILELKNTGVVMPLKNCFSALFLNYVNKEGNITEADLINEH